MGISENVKRLREAHHLSQEQLAEIAGVTDKAVSTWETGAYEPRMGAIQRIADYFGLKKSNLIEDDGLDVWFGALLPTNSLRVARAYDISPPHIKRAVDAILEPYIKNAPSEDEAKITNIDKSRPTDKPEDVKFAAHGSEERKRIPDDEYQELINRGLDLQ